MQLFKPQLESNLFALRKNVFAFVVIFILIFICYGNTFQGEWHFDDTVNVVDLKQVHMKEITWENIKATFFAGGDRNGHIYHPVLYRPVAVFSLALNYYWGELDSTGYHLFNTVVHILSVIFLFLFIHHTLNVPKLKKKYGGNSYSIALIAALLWGLHPIQIDSVTFVTQRMASMAGLFFIMSMYFYVRGRLFTFDDSTEQRTIKIGLYGFSFIAALLAMGCKENAIMLPLAIFLFDLFFIQEITKRNIRIYCMVFLWMVLLGLLATYALSGYETLSLDTLLKGYERREFTLYERLLTQPRILLMYLGLLAYPMADRLSFSHDMILSRGLFQPSETILAIIFIFAVIGLFIKKARQWPLLSYCILFYFLNHVPESSIFPLELTYEHRNYLPSMLLFVPVAILLINGATMKHLRKRIAFMLLLPFILIILGCQTHEYNSVWKTDKSLWGHTLKRNHNPRAIFNYGGTIYKMGYLDEALNWWGITAAHNEIFRENHSMNGGIVPFGKTINAARTNLMIIEFVKQAGYGEELKKAAKNMRLKINR